MVSILISSRNNPSKLANLLASIREQDCQPREVILIDDGSEPPYAQQEVNIQIRHSNCHGYVRSRNELAQQATGEYLLFLDDDVVFPDARFISRAVNQLVRHPDCSVLALGEVIPPDNENVLQPNSAKTLTYCSRYFGWAYLFRTATWRQSGGLCEIFDYGFEETEHSLRLLDQGFRILYDPSLKVIHHSASLRKNRVERTNQNLKNMLVTMLLRHHWSTMPRVTASVVGESIRQNELQGLNRKDTISWLVWILVSLIALLPRVLRSRKPVRRSTFRLASMLDHPPFFGPPNWPNG